MPLTDKQINTLKESLVKIKSELEGKEGFTTDYSESTGEVSNGVDNHMADQAAQYEDRMKEQTFQRVDQEKLQEVEEALQRMEDGSYGVCIDTGEEIPFERLEIVPYAKRTIEAQEKADQDGSDQNADKQFEEAMNNVADRDTLREDTLTTQKLDKEQDAYK
ncbi:TraR/DksA family transcriptional regulator [Alkalicoccobacillus murimartini]|uniref:RNA polymerase-binding protein DksA n=1 Tax=Alkalicoccobacillus murimartini TaxID=171685 RepID=A0ABT9YDX4_9BACI|nr:TraR/DksA C4-type zinc finger protein [Alkalicoccobacillus murimartini]MDQ0206046.1 RNA polymerase-binding protein DksA [Alkalicoccobacillus murimartini]